MHETANHLSVKYAFHKSAQTHAYLQHVLKLQAIAGQHQEIDYVYYKQDGQRIKCRDNDASYSEEGIKGITIEEAHTYHHAMKDHTITLRQHVPEDEFQATMKELGSPDYVVIKDRTIYNAPEHPQLRIYLDAKVQITNSKGHMNMPEEAFFEIQARYSDEDDKQQQENLIDTIITDIRNKHDIRPAPSYGDMAQPS